MDLGGDWIEIATYNLRPTKTMKSLYNLTNRNKIADTGKLDQPKWSVEKEKGLSLQYILCHLYPYVSHLMT